HKRERPPAVHARLLAAAMAVSLLRFRAGIALIPASTPVKLAAVGALGLLTTLLYKLANQRVVLPDAFPLPVPEPEPVEPAPEAAAQPGAAAEADAAPAKKRGTPVTVEIPDVIPPLERKEGEPVKMWVILEGEQFELEINEGENMLDAALDQIGRASGRGRR